MKIIAFIRLKPGSSPAMVVLLFILFSTFTTAKEITPNTQNINNELIHHLINNDSVAVKNILQHCGKCLPFIAPILLDWANGILSRQEKNYSESIRHYRKVISVHPDWYSARLQLATVLYLNKDILSAESQLRKLRSEPLPAEAVVLIDSFIAKIQKTDNWSFRGGFTYLNEKNINNAPTSGRSIGRWKSEKPQSGKGMMFWGEAEKTISLPDNFFGITRLATSGKIYKNNHPYDELDGNIGLGLGYRNIDTTLLLLPFYEKSYYGGGRTSEGGLKSYSDTRGVLAETTHQLSDRWRLYSDFKAGKNEYKKQTYLDGDSYSLNETLIYFPDSRQYISSGIGYRIVRTEEKDSSYNRTSFRLGWMYEWDGGISTLLQASYGYRSYRARDFWGITQINHEYSTSVTLWHRDIYFLGITPKITWNYQRTDSNHPFYDTERNRIFMSFSKYF
ncbi:DUF560 domain-containing protein [Salmonella enterica]|nr:DUF560 domain-containing protein [Salmonella enterica]EEU4807033.1 DUF560 domain-containing protein [Salmonella enterica]EEU4853448.1 DUF560 domain-containing protein [Salmonella enterica]EEU4860165.1 DUF560 domain-containing protein [Salmonella enterica]EEU4865060.1 DUF560 domain-containing protein [Salmonella enterica]